MPRSPLRRFMRSQQGLEHGPGSFAERNDEDALVGGEIDGGRAAAVGQKTIQSVTSNRKRRSKADAMLHALSAPVKIPVAVVCSDSRVISLADVIATAPLTIRQAYSCAWLPGRAHSSEQKGPGLPDVFQLVGVRWSCSCHSSFYAVWGDEPLVVNGPGRIASNSKGDYGILAIS